MSRPPRNGYTINSDVELASLNTSILPANTPLLNFDRKTWGLYTPPEPVVLWTPAAISTQLWLDAADSSTITTVSGGVSQWNDKSGSNSHALKEASPFPQLTTINGKNAIRFNGNTFLRNTVKQFPLQTRSVYIVFREYTPTVYAGVFVITPTSGNDYERNDAVVYTIGDKTATNFIVAATSASTYLLGYTQNPTQVSPLAIYQEIKNGSTGKAYLNTSEVASDSSFTEFLPLSGGGYLLGARYLLGAIDTSGYLLNGDMCEVVYLSYTLSVIGNEKMLGYLAHKWGLTASLPSDHPYKTTPPPASEGFVSTTYGFEYIPQNQIAAYNLTSITISTDTYELDLSQVNQYISITLTRNTALSVINAGKYTKYFIELVSNGYIVKNFTDIFALPKQYSQATLLTVYFGKQVLELQYINKLYTNIDYSDNISPVGSIITAEKIGWVAPSNEILYLAFASSTTTYTGAGISAIAATVGTPSISKSRLLLGATGRLEATKTATLDFNETDFTISFFSAKTTAGEFGCILGSHRASSVGFYVGVAADSTLFAIFGSNILSCALPNDIKEHSVVINRIGRIYKIFIDGVLSAHLKAANNFNNNSTEPLCIGSLKNATGTSSWTSQSWQGYLRQLTINTSASIPFSVNDVPPKDSSVSTTVLLLKYNVSDADFAQYSLVRSFTSTLPLITSVRLSKYAHIGYTATQLQITGNVTLEAKIFNPIGNTRGAIIDVEGGFTWGIFDLKLRIIFGTFTLDGVTTIPDSSVVDVAFVKSGTSCSLYLNGVLEATATTSEVMNISSSASEFSIKRTFTQDSAVASLNTSLFRSRSWIEISQLRVTKSTRYTGNYIPDFSYG